MRSGPPFKKGDPRAREVGRRGGQVTQAQRRAVRAPWTGSIIDLMDAAGMVGDEWLPWRSFWKAVYALPTSDDELRIFQKHTQREQPPSAPVAEAWMCIGRGGGKTRNSALHSTFRAITFDSSTVDPGEDVIIPLLASDRRQARSALSYIRGFNALPIVAPYVERGGLKELIEYKTGADIEVVTASRKAPRGYSCPTCCCDELAFWENEDDHANPDHEVLTALRGSLGRVSGSLLLALSNPAAPKGELYEAVEQYYGKDDPDVLVWIGDTLSMNPTYDRRTIERAFKRDAVVAMSEFGSDGAVTFRQARQALFDEEPLRVAIVSGRRELPPVSGVNYIAFIDAAEGSRSGDSMTLGIAHKEGARAVIDLLREVTPPFSPGKVIVQTFAPILREYGIRVVRGDRHAVGFVAENLAACSIKFEPTSMSKSELYAELLPLVNTGMVELLDHPTMRGQLLALERRSVRGGRDSIDHPRGGHDDVANAAAGAVVCAAGVGRKQKRPVHFSGSERSERDRDQHAALTALIASTRARLEAQDRIDQAYEEASKDAPMVGTPVWHVHRP